MSDDWMDLLGALVRDIAAKVEYESFLSQHPKRLELTKAMNALARTEAFKEARLRGDLFVFKHYIEREIGRPLPPEGYQENAATWELVRETLQKQHAFVVAALKRRRKRRPP